MSTDGCSDAFSYVHGVLHYYFRATRRVSPRTVPRLTAYPPDTGQTAGLKLGVGYIQNLHR